MIDWTKSMQQTYEYYEVDPGTWADRKRLTMVKSSSLERDDTVDTLGSASFEVTEDIDECYIRTYLIATQNGETQKIPLGTYLVNAPSDSYDGRLHTYDLDGYTPLIELKEGKPPIGYNVPRNEVIMDHVFTITREHVRAPVVRPSSQQRLSFDFISDINDDWFAFTSDLMLNAGYYFDLDGDGRILFAPEQDTVSLTPVFTYTDDNSSILLPEVSIDRDIYSIPNVVEVVYSLDSGYLYSRAVNNDRNSPTSVQRRGREIVHRVTDPELFGAATQAQMDEYAQKTLREMSTLECRITYSHGYNNVKVKDCVRLNYTAAEFRNITAKVVSQTIECKTGCIVKETAVFNRKLWG